MMDGLGSGPREKRKGWLKCEPSCHSSTPHPLRNSTDVSSLLTLNWFGGDLEELVDSSSERLPGLLVVLSFNFGRWIMWNILSISVLWSEWWHVFCLPREHWNNQTHVLWRPQTLTMLDSTHCSGHQYERGCWLLFLWQVWHCYSVIEVEPWLPPHSWNA